MTSISTTKKWLVSLPKPISLIESGRITDVIIGVGLNFSITDFPEELANKATSLLLLKTKHYSKPAHFRNLETLFNHSY